MSRRDPRSPDDPGEVETRGGLTPRGPTRSAGAPFGGARPDDPTAPPPSAQGRFFSDRRTPRRPDDLDPDDLPSRDAVAAPAGGDPTDPAAWAETAEPWHDPGTEWEEESPTPTPARTARRRARTATGRFDRDRGRPRARRAPAPAVLPALLGRLELLNDRIVLGLLGAGLLSLAAMAVVVGLRAGSLDPAIAVHLNAAGQPDRWGPPRLLWRLPLLAAMTLAINLILAWAITPVDRFAGRFVLAVALVVHLLAWLAVFDFL